MENIYGEITNFFVEKKKSLTARSYEKICLFSSLYSLKPAPPQ